MFITGSELGVIYGFRFGNDAEGRDLIDLSAVAPELAPGTGHIPFGKLPPKPLAPVTEAVCDQAFDMLDDDTTIEKASSVIDVGAAIGGEAGVDLLVVTGVGDLGVDDFLFV